MDCNGCDKNGGNAVPYISHEADMSRLERTIRRLWVLLIVMLVALVLSNLGWIMYESQFEDISIEAEQTAETGNNYAIGGDYNGEAESHH